MLKHGWLVARSLILGRQRLRRLMPSKFGTNWKLVSSIIFGISLNWSKVDSTPFKSLFWDNVNTILKILRCFLCHQFVFDPILVARVFMDHIVHVSHHNHPILNILTVAHVCLLLLLYGRHLDVAAGLYMQWTSKIMSS